MYAGVDGCAKGWVAFVVPTQRLVEGFPSFADLAGHLRELGVTTIGVDMPIEPPETGARECDLAVKKALGPKASSLFITPTRAALACATQAEATVVNKEHGGAGVSAQAFALRHKIREVEQAGVGGLIEVHPELTFHLLGAPRFPKRSWAGVDDTLDAAAAALTAARHADGTAIRFPARRRGPAIWA